MNALCCCAVDVIVFDLHDPLRMNDSTNQEVKLMPIYQLFHPNFFHFKGLVWVGPLEILRLIFCNPGGSDGSWVLTQICDG